MKMYRPAAALAAVMTVAGTVTELVSLREPDPAMPRCGYLLILLSLPLWLVAEVRRALATRGHQADDSYSAGFYDGVSQVEQAAGIKRTRWCAKASDMTERHGR